MSKKQRERLIKEFRYLYQNDNVPQEYLIKIIKVVAAAFTGSNIYHDLLDAVGIPYKDDLLNGWDQMITKAAKAKAGDSLGPTIHMNNT